jgi:hypothetical protein
MNWNHFFQPAVLAAIVGVFAAALGYIIERIIKRLSVKRALLSEISRLLLVVDEHYDWLQKQIGIDFPLVSFSTEVYDKFLEDWGYISPKFSGKATKFYGYLKFINRLQKTKKEYKALNKLGEFENVYKTALNNFLRDYKGKF